MSYNNLYTRVHYFEKIIFGILLGCILGLAGYIVYQNYAIKNLEKQHQSDIEILKQEKQLIINEKLESISVLLQENRDKTELIDKATTKVDSLSKVKETIQIVFELKAEEIENFSHQELVTYWQNELK